MVNTMVAERRSASELLHNPTKAMALAVALLVLSSCGSCFAQQAPATKPKPFHPKSFNAGQDKQKFDEVMAHYSVNFNKSFPSNFPIPPYSSNVTSTGFFNTTKGPPTAGGTISTKDQPQAVFDWYKRYCDDNKWAVKTPSAQVLDKMGQTGRLYYLDARKERQEIRIFCLRDARTQGTNVRISWAKIK
jgi:hypothetical protein